MPGMDRRDFLKTSAAAGALLMARPFLPALGSGPNPFPTSRTSRLFDDGTFCVHSDLHNHSLLSDGAGDPDTAYALMRGAGLDVAALTDHAILGKVHGHITCPEGECTYAVGINQESWERMRALADGNDVDDEFTAIRGFEWTSGHHGHLNVWMTEHWTDPLLAQGLIHPQGLANFIDQDTLGPLAGNIPDLLSSMDGFYEWLRTSPEDGGGGDGLAGFNHPNSWGNFENFRYVEAAHSRIVSCEIFTGATDFLFYGVERGRPSPINACLNAGWRVGMLGTTDEHGTSYGLLGKGRGGLWVEEWSRAGVFEALQARRFFATREAGLRVDAAASGPLADAVRMGGILDHTTGDIDIQIDLGGDPAAWDDRGLNVQVLRPGTEVPTLVHDEDVTVDDELISFTVPGIDIEDGRWLLLRITDPEGPADPRAPAPFDAYGEAVAYPSPFYLAPPE